MIEFLRQYYDLITHGVEFLAAVTGLFCLKQYRSTAAKYFICYLICVFIGELIGQYTFYVQEGHYLYFLKGTIWEKNYWFYTLFWYIGSVLFFTFFYCKILTHHLYKTVILIFTICFLLFAIYNIVFNMHEFFIKFFPSIIVFGAVIIMMNVCFYFLEMLQSDNILFFYKSLYFYISVALFFWWLITTPLVFYDIYFSTADWNFVFLKWQIFLFANVFTYLTFTFALIYCKPEND